MTSDYDSPVQYPSWSVFSLRDGERIERAVRAGAAPCCPRCTRPLEATPQSRFFTPNVVLDATAHDLVCEGCRRIWCIVRHSERSRRLMRMRRLAAAVVSPDRPPPKPRPDRFVEVAIASRPSSHFHAI